MTVCTMATAKEAVELYVSGLSTNEVRAALQERHGRSPGVSWIRDRVNDAGAMRSMAEGVALAQARRLGRPSPQELEERARELEELGHYRSEIARKIGVNPEWLRRRGIGRPAPRNISRVRGGMSASIPGGLQRRRLTQRILELRSEGHTLEEIAGRTGVSPSTVHRRLRAAQLLTPTPTAA